MAANEAKSSESELTLKRVFLFKTGVGCFEKKGSIDLSKQNTVQLSFKPDVMNDLLKTFLVFRESGDLIVSGISMDLKDMNTSQILEKSVFNIPFEDSLQALIEQLQGVKISVKHSTGQVSGVVIGSHKEVETSKNLEYVERYLVILDETNNMVRIEEKKIEQIQILDSKINDDMKFFMDVLSSARNEDIKNITIFFKGTKKSDYLIRFLQSVPAWKINYRIDINQILDEKKPENFDGKNKDKIEDVEEANKRELTLQAWTIVDNVLDEDWNNVELTLISGLPISFIYDSYSPNYGKRPEVSRDINLDISEQRKAPSFSPDRIPQEDKDDWLAKYEREYQPVKAFEKLINTQVKKGSAYTFKLKNAVSIMRNNSAMVPLFEKKIKGTKMCVYNETMQKDHPMLTIKLKNETEIPFDEGPVAVFEEDIFAGEAIIPFVNKGLEQQIPYSVDETIEVSKTTTSGNSESYKLEIKKTCIIYLYSTETTKYRVFNNSNQTKLLIIEHPKREKYELYETDNPIENSASYHRFLLTLEPFGKTTLEIKARSPTTKRVSINDLTLKNLNEWEQLSILSENQKEFIKSKLEIREKINELNKKKKELQTEKNEISSDQQRIRQILDVFKDRQEEESARKVLLAKLKNQEQKTKEIRDEEVKIEKSISDLNKKLNAPFKEGQ